MMPAHRSPDARLLTSQPGAVAAASPTPAQELWKNSSHALVVVAETIRGGPRDAPVNRVLKAIGSVPEARETHGRIAGRLLGVARSAATVDALVVAQAVDAGGAHILTGDRDDLARLAGPHPEVWIHPL